MTGCFVVLLACVLGAAFLDRDSVLAAGVRVSGVGAAGGLVGYAIAKARTYGIGSTPYSIGVVLIVATFLYGGPRSGGLTLTLAIIGLVVLFVELYYRSKAERRRGAP